MATPYDQGPIVKGLVHHALNNWPHGCVQVTRSLKIRGCTQYIFQKVGFKLYIMIFSDFITSFGRFSPFLEDLGPFLRPNLGGKLGVCCQLQAYINQRFLET
jgi:hypothetical protein